MKKPLVRHAPRASSLATSALAGHRRLREVGVERSATADKCVKYAGVESSGNKNSMDPAQQPSSQNSLNMNASYDRLTTEDDNWKVLPDSRPRGSATRTAPSGRSSSARA